MLNTKKSLVLKTELITGFFVSLLMLMASPVLAQDNAYGPPANIPDMSSFPSGVPSGVPTGMPTNIKMGPSEDQLQQINKQKLTQMRKGLAGFVKQMLNIKNTVNGYEKKGVVLPEELKAAMIKIDAYINTINTSEDATELEAVIDNFSEATDVVQTWLPKLPKLVQLPKIIKQAEKEIAKVDLAYNKDVKQMSKTKVDAASVLADFKTAIDNQKALLNEVKTLAKTDSDAAFDMLTDDFFSNIDNMWENEKVIQMTLNIKKGMTQMTAEINLAEKTTAALKKKKVNTAELEALIKKSKVEFENLKKLVNAKPFNADAVMDSVDILMETRQTYTDKLEDLTGNTEFKPELTATAPTPSIKINVPTGF